MMRFGKFPRCLLLLAPFLGHNVRAASVTVTPDADTFIRSATPTNNFGGAGAIAVSGSAAVNENNQQNGLFDSLLRFSMTNVVVSLDTSLGSHDWLIYRARLHLAEVGAPVSTIFNRGVGTFELRWLAANEWIEGTGIPIEPTRDGVTWNDVASLLDPAKDVSLGQFTNSGVDGGLTMSLALKDAFVSDVRSGSSVTFYLTAASPQIGFTAASRTFLVSTNLPELEIEADLNPHPRIDAIQLLGTNVMLSFGVVSNWTYTLQYRDGLPVETGNWSDRLSIPAQPTNSQFSFVDGVTNQQRFYRLCLSR
jgi:hypothetical protein